MRNQAARTAEQIEADVKAEREEMRARWAKDDAARAAGVPGEGRIEAQRLRQLAERHDQLASDARDPAIADIFKEVASKLWQKADELDPPTPEPRVVRETMHVWFVTERSDGTTNTSRYILAEPPVETAREVWEVIARVLGTRDPKNGDFGGMGEWCERVRVLKRDVFSGLTHGIGCEVFNHQGTKEGSVWAKAMAMFEEYRDSTSPF
jgi:hypothetical protein